MLETAFVIRNVGLSESHWCSLYVGQPAFLCNAIQPLVLFKDSFPLSAISIVIPPSYCRSPSPKNDP